MLKNKIFVRVLVTIIATIFPSVLIAGDYHKFESLICSDCHIMHYSKQHDYSGGVQPDPLLAGGGPFPNLLKNTPANLCLSCHDGKVDAPDVRGVNINNYLRAAGGLNQVGDSGSYAETNGHTIGSTNPPPGSVWNGNSSTGLLCQHCHETHGNQYYRNLKSDPGTATGKLVTYMTGSTYSGNYAIQQIASSPMSSHYSVTNIKYRRSIVGSTDFGISEWCSGCHGNFHGAGGSANMGGSASGDSPSTSGNEWLRHPTRDVTMAEGVTNQHIDSAHWFSSLSSRVPIVSPSGTIPGTSTSSDNEVFCGSCHKAHGSTNKFGLLLDDDQTTAEEDGTKPLDTCQQCHYK